MSEPLISSKGWINIFELATLNGILIFKDVQTSVRGQIGTEKKNLQNLQGFFRKRVQNPSESIWTFKPLANQCEFQVSLRC